MKKIIVPIMKKVGEKSAEVPIKVRSWPFLLYKPNVPKSLCKKMKQQDNK